MRAMLFLLASLAACGLPPAAGQDAAKPAWVSVRTDRRPDIDDLKKGIRDVPSSWLIRVDGGAVEQVVAPFEGDKRWDSWGNIPGGDLDRRWGPRSPDKKKAMSFEEDPATVGEGKKIDARRNRVVLVDIDGKNDKQLLTGLSWWNGYVYPCPGGTAFVFGAEQNGKWYPFRVAFDGTVTRLSETSGIDAPVVQPLADGRYLYHPITTQETVVSGPFSSVRTSGPVLILDGKKETVLMKDTSRVPSVSQDATKMALPGRNGKGEGLVTVTDLKTGKSEEILLSEFHREWKCEARELKFSPDGRALAVTFSVSDPVGNVGIQVRDKGPLPGDEAVEHFGVVWLDGRKQRTALFRVDQPREKNGHFAAIHDIEWSERPAKKK